MSVVSDLAMNMSTNSLNEPAVYSDSVGGTLSQATSQNELVEENLRLQQQLQTQSAEVARSHEELHLCKRKIEQLTNSQFADAEETPREVDLFADENMEEIFETIDTLRMRVEQLQIHCEKLAQEKATVDQKLIDREKHFQITNSRLQEEINFLRKTNLQLLSSQEKSNGSNTSGIPSWLQEALDAESTRTEIQNVQQEVESLQLTVLEKDKYITSLEWQLVDSDATIATLQAARDRLAIELECSVVPDHLSSVQGSLEAIGQGAMADMPTEDHYEYDLDDHSFDPDGFRRRVRKPARRHLSDLTRRDFSEIEDVRTLNQKTSIRSLSDVDVPRRVTSAENFALGTLKRSTNFSNINALDESEKFKLDDSMNKKSGSLASGSLYDDSSVENVTSVNNEKGLRKGKWQSFGSDSDNEQLKSRELQMSLSPLVTATSLNAWKSGDNLLVRGEADGTETKDGDTYSGDWQGDRVASALKGESSKNDSCSSSSAYFSADEGNSCVSPDLWTFTPDSIIDVSTGEVILNGEIQSPLKKAAVMAGKNPNEEGHETQSSVDADKSNKAGDVQGLGTGTGWANFERSTSLRSVGSSQVSTELATACHPKHNSEPAPLERSASVNEGYKKNRRTSSEDAVKQQVILEEYQKWKVTGRKGDPPAKLKISQC